MEGNTYTNYEKFDMLSCYILCHRNCINAALMYSDTYPERKQPDQTIFRRIVFNLKEYGSFKKPIKKRNKPSKAQTENYIMQAVVETPEVSTRQIERNTGIPKSTVHFNLKKKQKWHPFKFRICQNIKVGDDIRRRNFCEWYTHKCQVDENFPHKIIWTDESTVNNNGIFNRRNVHYWAQHNPRLHKISNYQERFGFNMWVGIFGTTIIGPFFYHGSLTSDRYLNLLQNDIEEALDRLPLANIQGCWYQQDGAPAHNSRAVRDYLCERFPNTWIGTHSTIAWPARSPDLTPLDFFLWGYIKNNVYKNNFQTEEELLECVREAFTGISAETLVRVLDSTVRRAYMCLENNGHLFEHLL